MLQIIAFISAMLITTNTRASEAVSSSSDSAPTTQTHLRKTRSAQAAERPLTAINFLEPIMDKYPRPKSWPDKLTFKHETEKKTLEELQKELLGTWRVSYTCSGRAIEAKVLANKPEDEFIVLSGIDKEHPYVRHNFDNNHQYKRMKGGTVDDWHNSTLSKAQVETINRTYKTKIKTNGALSVEIQGFSGQPELRLVHIVESDEKAFLVTDQNIEAFSKRFCRSGEEYQRVYTRESDLIVDIRDFLLQNKMSLFMSIIKGLGAV